MACLEIYNFRETLLTFPRRRTPAFLASDALNGRESLKVF
jgi:hypothetical protein